MFSNIKTNIKKKNLKSQYAYSILSIATALSMLGIIMFSVSIIRQTFNNLQESANIIIEFRKGLEKSQLEDFEEILLKKSYYKEGSFKILTKEEALKEMKPEILKNIKSLEMENPFLDIITFNINSEYVTSKNLLLIKIDLEKENGVQSINYQEIMLENVAQNINRVIFISSLLGLIFIALTIYLLYSTMKLSLYNKRFSVRTMQLVGATPKFISRPFIKEGLYIGCVGALISITSLIGLLVILIKFVPYLPIELLFTNIFYISIVLILIALGITGLSSWFIIQKFLKTKTEELF